MWEYYFKLLYDKSPWVRFLFWLFVICMFLKAIYELYGWVGIIVLFAILLICFWIEMKYPRKSEEEKELEKESEQLRRIAEMRDMNQSKPVIKDVVKNRRGFEELT